MLSKKEVMELYNRLVGYRVTKGVRVPVLDFISNLEDDIKVLDVATGTGVLVFELLEMIRPKQIIGLDLSEKELIKARRAARAFNVTNVYFIRGDGEQVCFKEDSFDLVTCNAGLHWMPHKEKCVREMVRVCRKGGKIAVYIPEKELDHAQFMKVASDIASKYNLQDQVSKFRPPSYSKDEAEDVFKKTGLHDVKINQLNYRSID